MNVCCAVMICVLNKSTTFVNGMHVYYLYADPDLDDGD